MEFVSNLNVVSYESSMKWTINNLPQFFQRTNAGIMDKFVIESKEVLFEEANSSWRMQVFSHHSHHGSYDISKYLNVKFILNGPGDDENVRFCFTAKITDNTRPIDAKQLTTCRGEIIDGKPMVVEADRSLQFDDSQSITIEATCKMETLRHEYLVDEPKKAESANSENEFEKLSMSEMESVETEIREGSDDEQSLLSAIDTEEVEADPVDVEVSIAEESLLSAIDTGKNEVHEEIVAAMARLTDQIVELRNKLEIAEQMAEIHKSCATPKFLINPVIERPSANASGSSRELYIHKASDSEDIETDDDDDEGGKLFGMSPMALTKRLRKVYLVKFRENADTSARLLVTAFRENFEHLMSQGSKALAEHLTPENFREIWSISKELNADELKGLIVKYVLRANCTKQILSEDVPEDLMDIVSAVQFN